METICFRDTNVKVQVFNLPFTGYLIQIWHRYSVIISHRYIDNIRLYIEEVRIIEIYCSSGIRYDYILLLLLSRLPLLEGQFGLDRRSCTQSLYYYFSPCSQGWKGYLTYTGLEHHIHNVSYT